MNVRRILVILITSWAFYLLLGVLICPVFHTGPHDWYQFPGITIEHYYGHGLFVDDIQPWVLIPALSASYVVTWCMFRAASQFRRR